DFVFDGRIGFDESHFIEVANNITISKNSKREHLYLFQEELNGGDILSEVRDALNVHNDSEDILLYGIDSNINSGVHSRNKGIKTARESLLACSDNWADIGFATNSIVSFDHLSYFASQSKLESHKLRNRSLIKKNGLLVFNIP